MERRKAGSRQVARQTSNGLRNGTIQQWFTPEQARPDATSITMPKHPGAKSTSRCSHSITAVRLNVDAMASVQGDSGVGSNADPILRMGAEQFRQRLKGKSEVEIAPSQLYSPPLLWSHLRSLF